MKLKDVRGWMARRGADGVSMMIVLWLVSLLVWSVTPVQAQQTVIKYLRQLLDVRFSTLANGDVLTYDSTAARWTNTTQSGSAFVIKSNGVATNLTTYGVATNTALYVSTYIAQAEIQLAYATATNLTLDASLGNVFRASLTNTTFFTAPINVKTGMTFVVICVQDATGGRSVTFQTNAWRFAGGTVPTISTNANAIDVISGVSLNTTNLAVTVIQNEL